MSKQALKALVRSAYLAVWFWIIFCMLSVKDQLRFQSTPRDGMLREQNVKNLFNATTVFKSEKIRGIEDSVNVSLEANTLPLDKADHPEVCFPFHLVKNGDSFPKSQDPRMKCIG